MTKLIQIGNSRGIRIPKALIESAGLEDIELKLEAVRGALFVKPVKQPRQGWAERVEAAIERGEVTYDRAWLDAELDSELDILPGRWTLQTKPVRQKLSRIVALDHALVIDHIHVRIVGKLEQNLPTRAAGCSGVFRGCVNDQFGKAALAR